MKHLIDLSKSNQDAEQEYCEGDDFSCNRGSHSNNEAEDIINSDEVEHLIEALEKQNSFK